MIVYYKECPKCYKLLPSKGPMIVRDTNKYQILRYRGAETHLLPGDILSVFCGRCVNEL